MAKFDVHSIDEDILVVDCQADLLSHLDSRFVVPMVKEGQASGRLARLNPTIPFEGSFYVILPQEAANLHRSELGSPVGSLAEHDLTIGNALDMLISGF